MIRYIFHADNSGSTIDFASTLDKTTEPNILSTESDFLVYSSIDSTSGPIDITTMPATKPYDTTNVLSDTTTGHDTTTGQIATLNDLINTESTDNVYTKSDTTSQISTIVEGKTQPESTVEYIVSETDSIYVVTSHRYSDTSSVSNSDHTIEIDMGTVGITTEFTHGKFILMC